MLMRIVLTKADVDVTFNGHIESSLKIADNLVPRLRIFCTYYFVQSTKYRTCMIIHRVDLTGFYIEM